MLGEVDNAMPVLDERLEEIGLSFGIARVPKGDDALSGFLGTRDMRLVAQKRKRLDGTANEPYADATLDRVGFHHMVNWPVGEQHPSFDDADGVAEICELGKNVG